MVLIEEEKTMIRTMLALEQARDDFVDGKMMTKYPEEESRDYVADDEVVEISSTEGDDERTKEG